MYDIRATGRDYSSYFTRMRGNFAHYPTVSLPIG